jgi:putative GTP pyrophosphokinase
MNKREIKLKYKNNLSNYWQLENEGIFIIKAEIRKARIKTHTMTSRVKDFESFFRKVLSKNTENPFKDIKDIVGLRVVCLFRSDIIRIGKLIRKSFSIISEDNKIEGYDTASFGYQSVHFVAKIMKEYKGPRYDRIKNIEFEIQVRTIAMDAWATISHYLDYKTDIDVPQNLRKDFYALSGLFYVADSHFEIFYNETKQSRSNTQRLLKQKKPELNQEINLDTLMAYMKNKLPLYKHSNASAASELVFELKKASFSTIKEIDNVVNKYIKVFPEIEKRILKPGYFSDVGIIRVLMSMANAKFLEISALAEELKPELRELKDEY